jgi:hypothetical protein
MGYAIQDKDLSKYQTFDLNQFDRVPKSSPNGNEIKFSVNCKTKSGREVTASDAEFESCLRESKANGSH